MKTSDINKVLMRIPAVKLLKGLKQSLVSTDERTIINILISNNDKKLIYNYK